MKVFLEQTYIGLQEIINHIKVLALIAVFLTVIVIGSISTADADDQNLVRVFVDDRSFSVSTDAPTVGAVLDKLNVEISDKDLIEPAVSTEINEASFNINIYRSQQITLLDGDKQRIIESAHKSPEAILEDAGVVFFEEDSLELTRVDDFVSSGSLGLKLVITRSVPVVVDLFGEKVQLRTLSNSVGELLSEKNISIDEADTVQPSLDTKITKDLKISLVDKSINTVTKEEVINFTTREIQDSSKPNGERTVQSEGTNGSKLVTYRVEFENNKEISRTQISSVVETQPVEAVVVVGTKAEPAPQPSTVATGGSRDDWLRASGIPESEWWAVDSIVSRESSWNPNAVNPSSGACGLAQFLPCSVDKAGANWNDPVNALTRQYAYVNARYGGYANAVAFWNINHWY